MKIFKIAIFLTPLAASIFGAFIAYYNEIPVSGFSLNIIAVLLGIPLAFLLGSIQLPFQRHLFILSLLLLGCMVASLWSFGIDGVHRWLIIGPASINISMVLSPLILYAIGISLIRHKFLAVILAISVSVIHVLQPDAGQAIAFGCAAIVVFLLTKSVPIMIRVIGIISIAAGISLAWRQPDPLPAVEQVEHILHLAARTGILGFAGIVLSIIFLLAPIVYTVHRQRINSYSSVLALAYIVYLIATFCVTEFGNFPVPIIGAGASSILGYYAIIGLAVAPYLFKTAQQPFEAHRQTDAPHLPGEV